MAYDPQGYVPGGASPKVGRAIVKAARKPKVPPNMRPPKPGVPDRQSPWPTVGPAAAPAPRPLTDVELAQQQIQPLIAMLTGTINARAHASADAVKGYTSSLAQQLAQTNMGAPYDQAIPQQAAVDAALQQSLTGKGNELAQGLKDRLAVLNEPGAVDPAVAATQQFGAGTGNAALASGSAALSNLIADRASAQGYGAKLPGIAGLSGIQELGKVQSQAVNDTADQTAPLYAKLPDIVQGIQSGRVEQQKLAQATKADNATAKARQQQLNFENRLAAKKFGLDVGKTKAQLAQAQSKTAWQKQYDQARLKIAQQGADAATQRAQTAQWKAEHPQPKKTAAPKASSSITHLYNDGFLYDSAGNRVKHGGKPVKVARTPGTSKPASLHGLTQNTYQTKASEALGAARHYHQPWKDGNGDTQPPLSWQQWLTQGQLQGIPTWILLEQGRRIYSQAEIKQGLIPGTGG